MIKLKFWVTFFVFSSFPMNAIIIFIICKYFVKWRDPYYPLIFDSESVITGLVGLHCSMYMGLTKKTIY